MEENNNIINDYAYIDTGSNTTLIVVLCLLFVFLSICGAYSRFIRFTNQINDLTKLIQKKFPSKTFIDRLNIFDSVIRILSVFVFFMFSTSFINLAIDIFSNLGYHRLYDVLNLFHFFLFTLIILRNEAY